MSDQRWCGLCCAGPMAAQEVASHLTRGACSPPDASLAIKTARSALLAVDHGAEQLDLPAAAALLAELRELRTWLGAVHDHVEDRCADLMGKTRRTDVEGVGRLVRYDGRKRTNWRHDDLLTATMAEARKRRFDPATGEAVEPDEALLNAIREAAAISYWRVGPLKKWGIDPDEYATVSLGRRVVQIL